MSIFGEAWNEAKQGAGDLINGGAHLAGDGLNAVGLHGAANWVDTEGTKIGYDLGADVPELQLGQTTDPAELVHGDPSAIRSAASKLGTFGSAFGETAGGLREIDTGHWEGPAADAFRAKFAPEPAKWSAASQAMGKAGGTLTSLAGAVESAQGQARQAIGLWEQGQQATATAAAAYNQQVAAYNSAAQAYDGSLAAGQNPGTRPTQPGPFSDPGEALREQAQQVLTSARSARNGAAASAAAAINAATSLAPAEPSFWSQVGDNLSDEFQAANLAGVSFSSGVLEGAADIVKFARSVDPMDPWNMEHPAEYVAGMSGTLAGLTQDAINPLDLVKSLVGTGWGSDPAAALGKLVPNVALTVLTDGGGAGASVSEDAGVSASEDAAAQSAADMTKVGDPVNIATGEVIFAQTDVTLPGVPPLVIERAHRSSQRAGRHFGDNWVSTFDQRLLVTGDRVAGVFADGRVLLWERDDADSGEVLPLAGPAWTLSAAGDGYAVHDRHRGLRWRYERRPGFWRYPGGQGEVPLVSVTDRAGHEITFTYDDAGQPAAVTHAGGYRVDVTMADGRIAGLSLGGVTLTSYQYDDAGRLAGIVNSSGKPLRLAYDDAGRMTEWTDRNGHSFRYTYDELGRCVRGQSPSGALTAGFSYDRGMTRWTDATGAVTSYCLDRLARVTAVTDPLGNVTRFARDERGRVTERADALGQVTRYAYDTTGSLLEVTRPDGSTARAMYDERGQAVQVAEPNGSVWRQDFDASGNRTALHAPDGTVTRWAYDDGGHLSAVTDPGGAVTRVACDAAGLPVEVTGPDGSVTTLERDQFGRVRRLTSPGGGVTALTWTAEGRPLSRTLPDGAIERWSWDAEGNPIRHVSPGGAVTAYEYGAFDMVSAVAWPDGTRSLLEYDGELRPLVVAHGGLPWRYAYDPAGRLVTETDYNGAVTCYERDAAGQVTRRVNAAGQETLLSYDLLGNVTERVAGGVVTTFGYDGAGRLAHAENPDAQTAFTRDALGQVTAETCNGATVATSYDASGHVTGRVTPSGAATTWAYDEAGLPIAMTAAGQEMGFRYGPGGRETSRDLPGGLRLSQDWDARGRLASQVLARPGHDMAAEPVAPGQVLQRRLYAYQPDGFVAGIEDLLTGNRAFGLDTSGRVTSAAGPQWAERYGYDALGNVTSAAWPPVTPERAGGWLAAGPQGRREVSGTLVSRAGNVSYQHDAAGRVISRVRTRPSRKPETWRYSWDADDRLTAAAVPDGTTWRYTYDALGRRIAKTHVSAGGEVLAATRFTWDGLVLAEQAEFSSAREQVTTWDYQPGTFAPVAQTSRMSLRDAPQEVIDEQFYSIITDLAGMPAELIAADGTLAGYQKHNLWGGTVWHRRGPATPLRFPGQYADDETGLYYNNQRYYDPVTGAYLTPDPLGQAPAPNPHAYVPNPHVLVDPLGLTPGEPPHLALGRSVVRETFEIGGKTIEGIHTSWLQDFAREQGAITYGDKLFTDIRETYTTPDTFAPKLIDRVVQMNGRISFSLKGVDVAKVLAGEEASWTASELRYIAGNPAAKAITTFFHGIVPF